MYLHSYVFCISGFFLVDKMVFFMNNLFFFRNYKMGALAVVVDYFTSLLQGRLARQGLQRGQKTCLRHSEQWPRFAQNSMYGSSSQ